MGEYDYVLIAEWPSDEAAAVFLLSWDSTGVVRTTSTKAFTMAEYKEIIEKLPLFSILSRESEIAD